jgi:hypothetical protein
MLFFRELRVGAGRQSGNPQRLDGSSSTPFRTPVRSASYRVKVSRGDFLAELKQPLKRRMRMRYSNEFYFVTPVRLVSTVEIPAECGLVEAGHATFDEWKEIV